MGFSAVFMAMSVVISSLGMALAQHQGLLLRLSGAGPEGSGRAAERSGWEASADVLLARHLLTAHDAGAYAFAGLFGKVVFWGTQFVALTLVPVASRGAGRRPVRCCWGRSRWASWPPTSSWTPPS